MSRILLVGHADEAELLQANLTHHFALGFSEIVVVTVRHDPEAAAVVRRFDPKHTHHFVLEEKGGDLLDFFSYPARWAIKNLEPQWIAFCDTDEFIVSRSGSIHQTRATDTYEMAAIPRFTALPRRNAKGVVTPLKFSRPEHLPIAPEYLEIKSAWLRGDRSVPYVLGKDAPKTLVRAPFIRGVLPGGHGIVTDVPFVTRAIDPELAIVHVPFTGLQRFARKVDAIREIVRQHGDRSDSEVAWHWRSWATLDDAGVCAEFERQILQADSEQTVTTASTLFRTMGEPTPPADPYSFGTLNTMVRYVDAIKPRAMPEWIDIPFDEHWYLEHNEDLRQSAENGTLDPRAHFSTVGIVEGRSPSRTIDPHFLRRELERYSQCYLELRDVYWLYFSLPASERPETAPKAAI